MFDFSLGEIALFVAVALIFIGPKDLPVVLRGIAKALKMMRSLASEFQHHLDEMVKEADLSEAHKELKNIKNFSLKNQVTRLLDPHNALEEKKILDTPLDPSHSAHEGLPRMAAAPPLPPAPSLRGDAPYNAQQQARLEREKQALENAPPFLPPMTAKRLIEQSPHWQRPDFIPPEISLHYGKRVLIIKEPVKEPSETMIPKKSEYHD